MILTITMNPSIDMSYPLNELKIDTVNRVKNVSKTAGGKGLNVTRVLHQLNSPVTATGLLGGNFGEFIKQHLDIDGISHDFSPIEGETRNSIAILHDSKQTELLESGPEISLSETEKFMDKFDMLLGKTSVLTISGSLPRGMDKNFYSKLIEKANNKNVKVLLDTSGETLIKSIKNSSKPFLIKPNEEEIEMLMNEKLNLNNYEKLKAQLSNEQFNGINWIVITLGSKGAIVKHKDLFYKVDIPKINVVSPVGSGDATIAGLAKAIFENSDDSTIIKTGMTTGMLNTMEEKTGHVDNKKFTSLFNKIKIYKK